MKIKFAMKISKKDIKQFRKLGVNIMDKELMQEMINKNYNNHNRNNRNNRFNKDK